MRPLALIIVAGFILFTGGLLRAAVDYNAILTERAVPLLRKLQVDISTLQTASLVDFGDFRQRPVTGTSLGEGWNTSYRCGYVQFRSRQGGGVDATPGFNSITFMRPDSLYLSLTVASRRGLVATTGSYDLDPYLPGCRLYVFYRENLVGQLYPNDAQSNSTVRRIYRIVEADLARFGVKPSMVAKNGN